MTSEKNRRYIASPGERTPPTQRTIREDWYSEGDVPPSSKITVEASIGSALVCFFQCGCGKQGRFSPADMRRRNFDQKAVLWDLAKKMRCRSCFRLGVITRISRVRVSGAAPQDL